MLAGVCVCECACSSCCGRVLWCVFEGLHGWLCLHARLCGCIIMRLFACVRIVCSYAFPFVCLLACSVGCLLDCLFVHVVLLVCVLVCFCLFVCFKVCMHVYVCIFV